MRDNYSHAGIGDESVLTWADDNVECTVTHVQKKKKAAINNMVANKDTEITDFSYIIKIQKLDIS